MTSASSQLPRPGDISALLQWCLALTRQGTAAARAGNDPELSARARQAAAQARANAGEPR